MNLQVLRKSESLLAFAALAVLCGIGAHLVAELASLGLSADGRLIFSARHIPLALLAAGGLFVLGYAARRLGRTPAWTSRQAAHLLPVAFVAQLAVCAVTQLGEGAPIESGDITAGVVAALLAGALGALAAVFGQRRLVGALCSLFVLLAARIFPREACSWEHFGALVRTPRPRALTFAGSRRPPPVAPVIDHVITHCLVQEQFGVCNDLRAAARAWRLCAEPGAGLRPAATC